MTMTDLTPFDRPTVAESDLDTEVSYLAMKARETAREKFICGMIREKVNELLDLCDHLRWGDGTTLGMALSEVERIGVEYGLQTDAMQARATGGRKRKKINARPIWDRDGWTCVSCGSHENLTVDHIHPVSLGGTDDVDNLQTMCGSCNSRKGARV